MAGQQYQDTSFYMDRVQNDVLSLEDLQAYKRGVEHSIEQFGDETGRETMIQKTLSEAISLLQSQQ
jgi:hypothetical protein